MNMHLLPKTASALDAPDYPVTLPAYPLLLSAPQGARLLGCSERKYHELRRGPGFPAAVLLGARCVRWHRDELAAYAKSLPRVTVLPEPKHLQRSET
jgi:predicted DNA-binding transcriptional regulator AlpA